MAFGIMPPRIKVESPLFLPLVLAPMKAEARAAAAFSTKACSGLDKDAQLQPAGERRVDFFYTEAIFLVMCDPSMNEL